jgi:signal transduction histidine kinase
VLHQADDAFLVDPAYRAQVDGAILTERGISVLRRLVGGVPGDVALAAAAGLVQVGGTAVAARHQTDVRMLDIPGYLLLASSPVALIVRRRWPVAVLLVAFATTLGYLLLGYPGGPIWMALIVAFGTALVLGHRIAAYMSLLAGYPGFVWLVNLVVGRPPPSAWVAGGIAAWMLLLVAASELVRNRRAFAQASRQRAIEEQRSLREAARRQATEERLGIARELHDVLGHSLSLINVQAGVALELMDRKPEQARTALSAIKQASKEALVDVQSVLASLRTPEEEAPRAPSPSVRNIKDLVRRAEAAGLVVEVRQAGQLSSLPANVDAAAYRIVQEALTNVVRHADATTVSIRVSRDEAALVVVVDDDGDGGECSPASGAGNGIRGMHDRAVALGGQVTAGPGPGRGFRVRAWLPVPCETGGAG